MKAMLGWLSFLIGAWVLHRTIIIVGGNEDPAVAQAAEAGNLARLIATFESPSPSAAPVVEQAPQGDTFGLGSGLNAELVTGNGRVFQVADTGAANTDFTITHSLGQTPQYYEQVKSSVTGHVYTGSVAATPTTLTLRHPTANAAVSIKIPARA